jgi:phage terminase large subunit-like protein
MKEMGATFEEHKVIYDNNPILRWCLHNTAKKSLNKDGIETIQPVKIQQNRRIDGTVSLLNAWVGYVKHYDEYMPYVK